VTRYLAIALLCALWLGGAIIVAAVVAPAAFAALPSRTLAGALVGRVLPAVFLSGLAIALVNVVLDAMNAAAAGAAVRLAASVVWAGCTAAAQFIVGPRIERLRSAAGGPIDALAPDAPLRMAFGRLHGASVGLLGFAMLAALAVLILAARAVTENR